MQPTAPNLLLRTLNLVYLGARVNFRGEFWPRSFRDNRPYRIDTTDIRKDGLPLFGFGLHGLLPGKVNHTSS
jgi:hypothetical protein